jgi:hypothetical protein
MSEVPPIGPYFSLVLFYIEVSFHYVSLEGILFHFMQIVSIQLLYIHSYAHRCRVFYMHEILKFL